MRMMAYRTLGRTGLMVSTISFGGGPVSGWAAADNPGRQIAVVRRAIESGINWFDTAPTYADGRSEAALGNALSELGIDDQVHIATKVRLTEAAFADIPGYILRSVEESLARLGRSKLTLLQLHNSVTRHRGDEPTSVKPDDVVGPRGVLAGFEELRSAGVVRCFGLTGLGQPPALKAVIDSDQFDTVQTPFNLLNSSAGIDVGPESTETDYGNQFQHCRRCGMGVFAIRVFAGGALLNREPSSHTRITRFFPMDLYERDAARARDLSRKLDPGISLTEAAIRFALSHPAVTSALIGFGTPEEIDEAVRVVATLAPPMAHPSEHL